MKLLPKSTSSRVQLFCGPSESELWGFEDDTFDSMVTDPPAGIAFMNKSWDKNRGGRDRWIEWLAGIMGEAYRVLKPGAHGLVWAIPRTSHWTAMALEDAGFVVRDVITHHFGSGFPKSLDVSKATDAAKQWKGWGTALKPASEHWILVRKSLRGTVAANVQQYGTGAINVDACRIGTGEDKTDGGCAGVSALHDGGITRRASVDFTVGRWPANLILSEEAVEELDRQSGISASRFFYCPKPSRKEREAGLEAFTVRTSGEVTGGRKEGSAGLNSPRAGAGRTASVRNHHPTVKPLALMRYLTRLITPPDGTVVDPFMGTGTTGCACVLEGFHFVGVDSEKEYVEMARARIRYWQSKRK